MPTPPLPSSLALAALLTACTVRDVPGDSTTTDTADPSTSTTTSVPTSTTTTVTATTTTATPTTGTPDPATTSTPLPGFIIDPDLPPLGAIECDGFQQLHPECPLGQKCTLDGDLGHAHCVAIADDPKGLYEPCTLTGDRWGLDDCDLGMVCFDVDKQGHGICHGLCDGTFNECACADPMALPVLCGDCAVGICFPYCHPLLQDCPEDQICIPNGNAFVCTIDASGDEGQLNDPCEFEGCDPGLACINTPNASSACMQGTTGCCQPFCKFIKGQSGDCPNPDQQCIQWFDPMMQIPPGLEDVGVCAIPS